MAIPAALTDGDLIREVVDFSGVRLIKVGPTVRPPGVTESADPMPVRGTIHSF